MARSGSKRRNRAASAQGQEADIAVLAIDLHFQRYAKPWFSVYAVSRSRYTQHRLGNFRILSARHPHPSAALLEPLDQ